MASQKTEKTILIDIKIIYMRYYQVQLYCKTKSVIFVRSQGQHFTFFSEVLWQDPDDVRFRSKHVATKN